MDIDMPSPNCIQAGEHTLLLSNDDQISPSTIGQITTTATAKDKVQLKTQIGVILFVCVLYANLYLCISPEVSIRETIICKAYYDSLGHDKISITRDPDRDRDCTVAAVQGELSLVSQVYITLAQLPGKQAIYALFFWRHLLKIICLYINLR
jgi:hypothetical protein